MAETWRAFETDNGPGGFSWELVEGTAWRASLEADGRGGMRDVVLRYVNGPGRPPGAEVEWHTLAEWERTCGALEPACGDRCDGSSRCELEGGGRGV
jgi:hypothetical protein